MDNPKRLRMEDEDNMLTLDEIQELEGLCKLNHENLERIVARIERKEGFVMSFADCMIDVE